MSRPATPRAPPSFAALVQSFFTEHLMQQRAMSPRTVATYRDAFVLFLDFAVMHLHKQPTTIRLQDITPALILAFLDHLLLHMLYNTGARVSEIIGVRLADVVLDRAACVHLHGKGRKQRTMPLWRSTVKAVRAWLRLNPVLVSTSALLPNRDGHPMTRTNVTQRLALAVATATPGMASLRDRRISPHTVRHTTAMHLLQSGEPIEGIALWLGHESPTTTHQYVEANLTMKEKALAKLQDPDTAARRFRATDSLLEFLKTL